MTTDPDATATILHDVARGVAATAARADQLAEDAVLDDDAHDALAALRELAARLRRFL